MRLISLHLENFCQHRDLTIEFPVGITGIVGANGSGKSTVAQALRFAILGESGNEGSKVDDLNWAAAEAGEGGSVEWVFEKDGEVGTLKRVIQRASASLKWGDVSERSVSGVNTKIMEIIGRPQKILEDIVFVMQGKIDSVLFDRPAERKKNFHALFGIDRAEDVRELLRKELTTLDADPNDERIKELELRLSGEIDPQLKTLMVRQQELKGELAQLDRTAAQAVAAAFNEAANTAQRLRATAQALEQSTMQSVQLKGQQEQLQLSIDKYDALINTRKGKVDEMRAKLATIESAKTIHDTIVRLQSDRQKAVTNAQLPNPTPPDITQEQIDEAAQQVMQVRGDMTPKQKFIEAFEHSPGDAKCPTCGQTVPDASEQAARMRQELAERRAKIAAVESALGPAREQLRKYEREYQTHKATVEAAERALATIDEHLASMGDDPYTADAEGLAREARQTIAEYEDAERNRTQMAQQMSMLAKSIGDLDGRCAIMNDQAQALGTQLANAPTEEQCKAAQAVIEAYDVQVTEFANVNGRIEQLQAHRGSTVTELERLKQQASSMAAVKEYRDLCERARTLFHHDCLPQVATQSFLGGLNAHLAKYLQTFNVPFGCAIDEELTPICTYPDGGRRTAKRLSGGQKVMLGIAFRFAIYDMFAADLGFMLLDEPTNMLDDDRIDSVVEVLEAVRRYSHNVGMQLTVITHEQALMQTFDHTEQL